jgi:hypothetical protein
MLVGVPMMAHSINTVQSLPKLDAFTVAMLVRFRTRVGVNNLMCEIPQYKNPSNPQQDAKDYWPALRVRMTDKAVDACGGVVSHINMNVLVGGSNANFDVRVFPESISLVLFTVTSDSLQMRVDPMQAALPEVRMGAGIAMDPTTTWDQLGDWKGNSYAEMRAGSGGFSLYSMGVFKPGFQLNDALSITIMEYFADKVAKAVGDASPAVSLLAAPPPSTCPFRDDQALSPCWSNNSATAACADVAWNDIPSLVTARADCRMAVSNYCSASALTDPACFCWNPAAPQLAYPGNREACKLWRAFVGNDAPPPAPPPAIAPPKPAPVPKPRPPVDTARVTDFNARPPAMGAAEVAREIESLQRELRAGGAPAGGVTDFHAGPLSHRPKSAPAPAPEDGSGFSLMRTFRWLFQ